MRKYRKRIKLYDFEKNERKLSMAISKTNTTADKEVVIT